MRGGLIDAGRYMRVIGAERLGALARTEVDSGILDDFVGALDAGVAAAPPPSAVAGADAAGGATAGGCDAGSGGGGGGGGDASFALAVLRALAALPRFALGVEFMSADARARARALLEAVAPGAPEEAARLRVAFKV